MCLLFTRYKKTLSLYDVITTKVDPPISTNPSYVPTSNNPTDNNGNSGTGIYIDINEAFKSVLPPAVNIDENPAYGKLDYDYIYDITHHSHLYIHSILYSLYNNYILFNNLILIN